MHVQAPEGCWPASHICLGNLYPENSMVEYLIPPFSNLTDARENRGVHGRGFIGDDIWARSFTKGHLPHYRVRGKLFRGMERAYRRFVGVLLVCNRPDSGPSLFLASDLDRRYRYRYLLVPVGVLEAGWTLVFVSFLSRGIFELVPQAIYHRHRAGKSYAVWNRCCPAFQLAVYRATCNGAWTRVDPPAFSSPSIPYGTKARLPYNSYSIRVACKAQIKKSCCISYLQGSL